MNAAQLELAYGHTLETSAEHRKRITQRVTCPTCGAQVGQSCWTLELPLRLKRTAHLERRKAAGVTVPDQTATKRRNRAERLSWHKERWEAARRLKAAKQAQKAS